MLPTWLLARRPCTLNVASRILGLAFLKKRQIVAVTISRTSALLEQRASEVARGVGHSHPIFVERAQGVHRLRRRHRRGEPRPFASKNMRGGPRAARTLHPYVLPSCDV